MKSFRQTAGLEKKKKKKGSRISVCKQARVIVNTLFRVD